jgi:hypothetical protein
MNLTETLPVNISFPVFIPNSLLTSWSWQFVDSDGDDNVPIAETLTAKAKRLTMLATLASQPNSSPKGRKKKEKKTLWTYETVAEPTGMSSRYWDAEAPQERATKRRAKERLVAIHEPDEASSGAQPLPFTVCFVINSNIPT